MGAWWVGENELDADQKKVISLPADGNHLVVGPPGSGKTNILLLRAKYMMRAVDSNIAIVVFTKALSRFIVSGGQDYSIPPDKITTCMKWQFSLLDEYGLPRPASGNFQERRNEATARLTQLVEERGLYNLFSTILLDEAQDYSRAEIQLFYKLGRRLFAVADGRQQIYQSDGPPLSAIREVVDEVHPLRYHYRNGKKICSVADGVGNDSTGYELLFPTSRYDEVGNQSQVSVFQGDLDAQCRAMVAALRTQLRVFRGEFLGVVCPTNDMVNAVWERLQSEADLEPLLCRVDKDDDAFDPVRPICVTTVHSAKGLEVRALHFAAAEHTAGTNQRNVVFTAATRAKTSLSVYHEGALKGWFQGALESLGPPKPPPTLQSLFGGV